MRKPRRVFPRYPIPAAEDLDAWVKRWAKEEGKTYNGALYVWVRGRVGDILKSREDIEEVTTRETRRIEKATKCIEIALKLVKDEGERNEMKDDIFNRLGLKFD